MPAVNQDGGSRDGAWVTELTNQIDLSPWPSGTRLICRRERPHPGAQLSFTDLDGHRFQCFITDQDDRDIAALEALHRQHAEVEDRVKTLKASGAGHLPFQAFQPNAAWFELALLAHDILVWTQQLLLDGEHAVSEPKRLRYRILHVAGQITRHARRPRCTCPPTGPGPQQSCAPSSAWTPSPPTAESPADTSTAEQQQARTAAQSCPRTRAPAHDRRKNTALEPLKPRAGKNHHHQPENSPETEQHLALMTNRG
jgi:Transposase DDE domain group 1